MTIDELRVSVPEDHFRRVMAEKKDRWGHAVQPLEKLFKLYKDETSIGGVWDPVVNSEGEHLGRYLISIEARHAPQCGFINAFDYHIVQVNLARDSLPSINMKYDQMGARPDHLDILITEKDEELFHWTHNIIRDEANHGRLEKKAYQCADKTARLIFRSMRNFYRSKREAYKQLTAELDKRLEL